MQMLIDQALELARTLSPADAEGVYHELLTVAPGNPRVLRALEALRAPAPSPPDMNPPAEALEQVIALFGQGRIPEALDRARALIAGYPHGEVLHNITGALYATLGRIDEAVAHYDRAVAIAPDYFEAHNNRGNALKDAMRLDEAVASFDMALRFHPDYAEAHTNRGIALARMMRTDEAIASHDRAVALNPHLAEAYNNRGNALTQARRCVEALTDFDRAIALRPNFADAFVNRGNALKALTRPEEALASYEKAIAIAPAHIEAYRNRGTVLRERKRLDEALASFGRAVELRPDSALAQAEARNLRAHMCLWTDADNAQCPPPVGTGDEAVPPFYMLRFEDDPERQLECAKAWSAARFGPARQRVFGTHAADGRIRIGYFSADFHNHATMYLIARLFELHDRRRFEIHAFSYGPDARDAMHVRLIDAVDVFHDVGHLADEAIAALARGQAIDIAIDLKGHTQDTRSGILAHRAAPVQVNYLGYPGTMGTDFIDAIIADAVTIPPEHQRHYSERVVYLPNCYQPNDNARAISDRQFSRAELGLPDGGFVFACFNNGYKITPAEFDIWMRLLIGIEGSVLWLLKDNDRAVDNLRREAAVRGVAADRLIFAERMPLADHLARHAHADLFLDTFNVNAHTTASDALWAGLPVVTRLGNSFAARVAGSLLHAVGLPDLVTATAEEYETLAFRLATEPAALAAVRDRLTRNRQTTPLFDTERYTRDIEALYERLCSE